MAIITGVLKRITPMTQGRGARETEIFIWFERLGTNTKLLSLFLVAIEIKLGYSNFSWCALLGHCNSLSHKRNFPLKNRLS